MHLLIPSYAGDPTSVAPLANAHCGVTYFGQDTIRQTISVTMGYYRTLVDYLANVSPVGTATYTFTPVAETRADGSAIPSYVQVIAMARTAADDPAGTLASDLISRAVVGYLLTLPEFAGATVVA